MGQQFFTTSKIGFGGLVTVDDILQQPDLVAYGSRGHITIFEVTAQFAMHTSRQTKGLLNGDFYLGLCCVSFHGWLLVVHYTHIIADYQILVNRLVPQGYQP